MVRCRNVLGKASAHIVDDSRVNVEEFTHKNRNSVPFALLFCSEREHPEKKAGRTTVPIRQPDAKSKEEA
jgi:hypothetical protein